MFRTTLGAIVLVLLSGCASGLNRPVTSVDAKPDANGVQHVEIGLHSFYFKPNRVVVHAGKPVELVVHNRSIFVPHNLTIADSTMSVSVSKWGFGSSRATFTPSTPGEYRFFCHVDKHGKKGMTGTLVVEP